MTMQEQTIAKIRQLPESLVQEVSDFVDFLLLKHSGIHPNSSEDVKESQTLVEAGFSDYLSHLEAYEEQLAKGEIQW